MTNTFRLGDIAEVFNGKTPAKSEQRSEGYPVLKIRDVDEEGAHRGAFGSYVDDQLAQKYRSKWIVPGDTLILNAAHNADYVGSKTFFAGDSVANALPTGEWLIVRPGERASAAYVNFWLRSRQTRDRIRFTVKGIHLYPKDVAALEISLPLLEEQRRIVDLLSRAEGIVRLRREAQRKAAELVPALFVDMFGDPASNPKGWQVARIGDLGRVQLGRQRAPKYQTGRFTRPYVRVANVFEDRIDTNDLLSMDFDGRDFAQYRLGYGDILLNEGQSIELVGRPAMWRNEVEDCCFQNTLVRFQPNKEMLLPEFALAAMLNYYRSGALSKISSKTSNVAHLGASRFANMTLFTPPIALQRQFAAKADAIRAIAAQQTAALATAQATFDALLHQSFAAA